jgi:hypothetical protein
MATGPSTNALTRSAGEVCQRVELPPDARALLRDRQTAAQLLAELVKAQQFPPAAQLVAHALPKRSAVWWACQCLRQVPAATAAPPAKAALAAAERWVGDPSEENRRAAHAAAEKAGFDTPAGCTALAAFLSGGSLAPPNVPEVPPAEHLTAAAVAGAVLVVGVLTEPEKAQERYAKFFALAADVDSGKNRWPESAGRAADVSHPQR